MFIRVDLPDPEGPMMATNSPLSTSEVQPPDRLYHDFADLIVALDAAHLDDCHELLHLDLEDDLLALAGCRRR